MIREIAGSFRSAISCFQRNNIQVLFGIPSSVRSESWLRRERISSVWYDSSFVISDFLSRKYVTAISSRSDSVVPVHALPDQSAHCLGFLISSNLRRSNATRLSQARA